jgi:hypothetical protein
LRPGTEADATSHTVTTADPAEYASEATRHTAKTARGASAKARRHTADDARHARTEAGRDAKPSYTAQVAAGALTFPLADRQAMSRPLAPEVSYLSRGREEARLSRSRFHGWASERIVVKHDFDDGAEKGNIWNDWS